MAETQLKIPRGQKVTVQGEEVDPQPEDVDTSHPEHIPLFPNFGKPNAPVRLAVTRLDPPDGYLGECPVHTTEEGLKRLYGGRVLQLDLRGERGTFLKGGQRILTIDAPPVTRHKSSDGSSPTNGTEATAQLLSLQGTLFERSQQTQTAMLRDISQSQREMHTSQLLERESAHKETVERDRQWHQQTLQDERARHDARMTEIRTLHQQQMERMAHEREVERERQREHTQLMLTVLTTSNTTVLQATNKMTEVLVTMLSARGQNELTFPQMLELMDRFGGREAADPAVEALKTFGSNVGGYLDLAKTTEMRKLKELALKNPEKAKELLEKFTRSRSNGKPTATKHEPLPPPAPKPRALPNAPPAPPTNGAPPAAVDAVLTPERMAKVQKLFAVLDEAGVDVDFVLDDTMKNAEQIAQGQGEEDASENPASDGETSANGNAVANGAGS